MQNILTISGWGQPHDALSILAPDAMHIDIAGHTSAEAAMADMATHTPDLVIGWSLGGQLAVRAIAAGLLKPSRLVLIAAPFQFVKTSVLPIGMPRDLFDKFRDNYSRNPLQTLTKAWELITKDDTNANQVRGYLDKQDKNAIIEKNWLAWLDMLESFSCENLPMADFPPTTLIHGDQDLVVYPEQLNYFSKAIPHAKFISIKGCGHAPHWHDPEFVKQVIYD